jgi:hypothetical protein
MGGQLAADLVGNQLQVRRQIRAPSPALAPEVPLSGTGAHPSRATTSQPIARRGVGTRTQGLSDAGCGRRAAKRRTPANTVLPDKPLNAPFRGSLAGDRDADVVGLSRENPWELSMGAWRRDLDITAGFFAGCRTNTRQINALVGSRMSPQPDTLGALV